MTDNKPIYWSLRVAAAACFIGHGVFGIITKAAWVPYFGVIGIPEAWAWKLMPIIGTVDIVAGLSVLFSPRPIVLLYMAVWATWTALLRPLSGDSSFEMIERAGNYGVPLALLLMFGWPRGVKAWLRQLTPDLTTADPAFIARILAWTTAMLLFGHGALSAFNAKPTLVSHYALVGLPPAALTMTGWAEIIAAVIIAIRPNATLLLGVVVWKMATEALYPVSGTPIWEFVERAGSYAAPLALALILIESRMTYPTLQRSSR
ncbi:MAG TPA: hypothetical protein VM076_10920 [Gemmatimonadaceae bacterium]|nr:hypothetical protein [Gemmatimonadaceae bacterium]